MTYANIVCHVCGSPMRDDPKLLPKLPLRCSDATLHRQALASSAVGSGIVKRSARYYARKVAAGRCPKCSWTVDADQARATRGLLCAAHHARERGRQKRVPASQDRGIEQAPAPLHSQLRSMDG